MSNTSNGPDGPSFAIGLMIGLFVSAFFFGMVLSDVYMDANLLRKQAIERNVAAYNSKTGSWEWTVAKPFTEKLEQGK